MLAPGWNCAAAGFHWRNLHQCWILSSPQESRPLAAEWRGCRANRPGLTCLLRRVPAGGQFPPPKLSSFDILLHNPSQFCCPLQATVLCNRRFVFFLFLFQGQSWAFKYSSMSSLESRVLFVFGCCTLLVLPFSPCMPQITNTTTVARSKHVGRKTEFLLSWSLSGEEIKYHPLGWYELIL
jgi:hypothetical protein